MSGICNLSSSDDSDFEYYSAPYQLACERKIIDLNTSFNSEDSLEYVDGSKFQSNDACTSTKGMIVLAKNSIKISIILWFLDAGLIKEHTVKIIAHNLKFGGSYHSMEQFAQVVNETPDASIRVPSTRYKIKKLSSVPKFTWNVINVWNSRALRKMKQNVWIVV